VFILILPISFFGILIGYFWRPPNNNSIILNNNNHPRDTLGQIKLKYIKIAFVLGNIVGTLSLNDGAPYLAFHFGEGL
jgi:hypothetical protein